MLLSTNVPLCKVCGNYSRFSRRLSRVRGFLVLFLIRRGRNLSVVDGFLSVICPVSASLVPPVCDVYNIVYNIGLFFVFLNRVELRLFLDDHRGFFFSQACRVGLPRRRVRLFHVRYFTFLFGRTSGQVSCHVQWLIPDGRRHSVHSVCLVRAFRGAPRVYRRSRYQLFVFLFDFRRVLLLRSGHRSARAHLEGPCRVPIFVRFGPGQGPYVLCLRVGAFSTVGASVVEFGPGPSVGSSR